MRHYIDLYRRTICVLLVVACCASCGGGSGGGDGQGGTSAASGSSELAADTRTALLVSTARVATAGYGAFVSSVSELSSQVQAFCSAPSNQAFQGVQQAWRSAMSQWAGVQAIRFGPIQSDNRFLQTQFWPDSNDNVARAVDAVLASGGFSDLASASVAARGLSALEVLLFRDGFSAMSTSQNHCDYARAAAALLVTNAQQVAAEWNSGYALALTSAGAGSNRFGTVTQAVVTVLTSLASHTEQIKNNKVRDTAGLLSGSPQLQRLETKYANIGVQIVKQNIRTIRALYFGGADDGIDGAVSATGDTALNSAVQNELGVIEGILAGMSDSLQSEITNNRSRVSPLVESLTVLVRLLKNNMPLALGVSIGFNDTDGD